jgi:hypothetical protein
MHIIETLKEAIKRKKCITFEYIKAGKVRGWRHGNPHVIFGHPSTDNLCTHIYQTGGVSDSKEELPGWRLFLMEHILDLNILEDQPCFEAAPGYNPLSAMYINVVEKI